MFSKKIFLTCAVLLCVACSPKFDWREVRGTEAAYSILMPGKPASFSKEMQLAGITLKMTMTATEAGGVNFAVGSAKLGDPGQAGVVIEAMKTGMIHNIQGQVTSTNTAGNDSIEVHGKLQNGTPVLMVGRFLIRGNWVYQVVAIGTEKALTREVIDTYMTSLKTN